MDAIHINKTRIFPKTKYNIEDFEILTTVLSALKWREHNGKITMFTDSAGYEYYAENNLLSLWDGGVSVSLNAMPDINSDMFWAGGKIFALGQCSAPVAMIDTDFIVWAPLAFDNLPALTVIHSEDIYPDVYPPREHFKMKSGYRFDKDWNWSKRPLNTAFTVIKSEELLQYYTKSAMDFMQNAEDADDNLTYMVFAEQRLLAMCADKMGVEVKELSNLENLFRDGERYFTHIWGMKQQMRDNGRLRYDFCMRCLNRIKRDFPHMIDILKKIDCLKGYF
ncbi:MAG: hypothetical protein LUD03_00005 [Firmicutes bacterium]|nr:hypothetical protein [Bacillota bacterium]